MLTFHITKITSSKRCELVFVSVKVQTSIINLVWMVHFIGMYQPQFPYGINNLGIWRNGVLFHQQGGEILLDLYSKIYFRLKILSRFHRTRKSINCITKSDHFFKPGMLHVQAILKTNKDFLCHHRTNLDLFQIFQLYGHLQFDLEA